MDNSFKISVLNSLDKHGIKATSFKQINFGRNSLSWEIMNNEKSFFLKRYISRPGDLRDRLFTWPCKKPAAKRSPAPVKSTILRFF